MRAKKRGLAAVVVRQCVYVRPSQCADDGALSSAICTQIEISASPRKLRRRGRRAARQNKTKVVSPPGTMRQLILFRGCPSARPSRRPSFCPYPVRSVRALHSPDRCQTRRVTVNHGFVGWPVGRPRSLEVGRSAPHTSTPWAGTGGSGSYCTTEAFLIDRCFIAL